jgi:hypothetical protein
MPHFGHGGGMGEDFAVAKTALDDEARSRSFRRRRLIAAAFVPGLFLVLYLIALYINNR